MAEKVALTVLAKNVAEMEEFQSTPKKRIAEIIQALADQIYDALSNGTSVYLHGIGTIKVQERKGREGRNPKTGEKLTIPASKKLKIKTAPQMATALNGV